MGLFNNMENGIGNFFGKIFGRNSIKLDPEDYVDQLRQKMEECVVIVNHDQPFVPHFYRVKISTEDFDQVEELGASEFADELAADLKNFKEERGYNTSQAIVVTFVEEFDASVGTMEIEADVQDRSGDSFTKTSLLNDEPDLGYSADIEYDESGEYAIAKPADDLASIDSNKFPGFNSNSNSIFDDPNFDEKYEELKSQTMSRGLKVIDPNYDLYDENLPEIGDNKSDKKSDSIFGDSSAKSNINAAGNFANGAANAAANVAGQALNAEKNKASAGLGAGLAGAAVGAAAGAGLANAANQANNQANHSARNAGNATSQNPNRSVSAIAKADLNGPHLKINGQIYPLKLGKTVVGRGSEATIQIKDTGISRKHIAFELTTSGTIVKDLGSTNGMYIEGNKVPAARLINGNVLTIGRTIILYYNPLENK
ncbi:MAG: DUF3662 and FHA domain-containing protein [Bifidobacteriaceae bacterium]|jgi:hypothetical protein|nr:DUF3662 and FHA domain-containing protein [Bifidobacteriaceae bacterium]